MHRRLLAALAAGAAVLIGLQAAAAPPAPTVPVYAASRDLPAGVVLRAGDLSRVGFSPESVPAHAVSREDAVGRLTASPLRRGEPVTDVRLVGPDLGEGYPGYRATPIRLPDAGVVQFLRVGDRIDLFVTDPQSKEPATLVAERVPVLAIPRNTPESGESASPMGSTGRMILVGLPPDEVTSVLSAAVSGFLTVVLSR